MFRILTKADILLFLTLVLIGVGALCYGARAVAGSASNAARLVQITVDNQLYGTYPLDTDQVITIEREATTNVVTIEGGTASMTSSTCTNQICVNDGSINTVGQQIVCLPNRVVVEIIGNETEKEFDAISQ